MDATIWLDDGHPLSRGWADKGKTDTTNACGVCRAAAGAPCEMTTRDRHVAHVDQIRGEWREDIRRAVAAVAALRSEPAGPYPSSQYDSAIDAAVDVLRIELDFLELPAEATR